MHLIKTVCVDSYTPAFEGVPVCRNDATTSSDLLQTSVTRGTAAKTRSSSSNGQAEYPVIVFAHGMGGMRTVSSGICCDLASHGYIVAAIEHR